MTEQESFMIESALSFGFTIVDDNASVFQCTQEVLIELIKAYMEKR